MPKTRRAMSPSQLRIENEMAYTDSDLNNPYHGDFVFAVTQGSINAVMMDYISTPPFPEVTCVWVMSTGSHPQPEQINFKELLKRADNSNPFKVPDNADPKSNQDLKNLAKARFLGGFKAQMGLPSGLPEDANMVTLGADVTSVKFDLMCSEFDVVQYTPGGDYTEPSWMHKSQTNQPWIFESRVNLQLVKFEGKIATLPRAVQDRINALQLQEGTFSIQQLLFILDNPGNATPPAIIGVANPSLLYTWLEEYFVGAYWATMKANKQLVLAHGITTKPDNSSLALADLKFRSALTSTARRRQRHSKTSTRCATSARRIHKSCRPRCLRSPGTGSMMENRSTGTGPLPSTGRASRTGSRMRYYRMCRVSA
jgi:hypothetical protein